jgi:hypothetical protein
MTREEREALVRRAWFGEGTAAEAVAKIVDAWEADSAEMFDQGVSEGRSANWNEAQK